MPNPGDFPTGLQLWFKADSLSLSNDDPVSLWVNSGPVAADLAQGTLARQPIFKTNIFGSLPAVRFDGVDDYMTTTAFSTWTKVYAVFYGRWRSTSSSSGQFLMSNGNNWATNNELWRIAKYAGAGSSAFQLATWGTTTASSAVWETDSLADNQSFVAAFSLHRDTNSGDVYLNPPSSLYTTRAGGTADLSLDSVKANDLYWLGGGLSTVLAGLGFASFDLAEFALWVDTLPSPSQRADIEDYLIAKWGATGSGSGGGSTSGGSIVWLPDVQRVRLAYYNEASPTVQQGTIEPPDWLEARINYDSVGACKDGSIRFSPSGWPGWEPFEKQIRLQYYDGVDWETRWVGTLGVARQRAETLEYEADLIGLSAIPIGEPTSGSFPDIPGLAASEDYIGGGASLTASEYTTWADYYTAKYADEPLASWGIRPDLVFAHGVPSGGADYTLDYRASNFRRFGVAVQNYVTHLVGRDERGGLYSQARSKGLYVPAVTESLGWDEEKASADINDYLVVNAPGAVLGMSGTGSYTLKRWDLGALFDAGYDDEIAELELEFRHTGMHGSSNAMSMDVWIGSQGTSNLLGETVIKFSPDRLWAADGNPSKVYAVWLDQAQTYLESPDSQVTQFIDGGANGRWVFSANDRTKAFLNALRSIRPLYLSAAFMYSHGSTLTYSLQINASKMRALDYSRGWVNPAGYSSLFYSDTGVEFRLPAWVVPPMRVLSIPLFGTQQVAGVQVTINPKVGVESLIRTNAVN